MNQPRISVLLVDEQPLFRRGVADALAEDGGITVVADTGDATEALAVVEQSRPDIVVLNVHLGGFDGIDLTRVIRRAQPGVRVITLTESEADDDIFAALRAGATGYLLKATAVEALAGAIRAVAEGGAVFSPSVGARLVQRLNEQPRGPSPAERLTVREREVLRLLTRGLGNRAIAAELFIAENTVKNHVRSLLDKLGVRTRTEAAILAAREGL